MRRRYAPRVRARGAAILTALLLAGGAAGCANSEVEEANAYVEQVNGAQARFAEVSENLLQRVRPDEPSRANQALLARFAGEVDDLAERLRQIEPPARVRSLHERLAAAMTRFGTRVRTAGRELASGNAGRILDGQENLAEATAGVSRSINASIADINAALQR